MAGARSEAPLPLAQIDRTGLRLAGADARGGKMTDEDEYGYGDAASRYCSGVMNLSLFYVPVIAALYALARGARKLSSR